MENTENTEKNEAVEQTGEDETTQSTTENTQSFTENPELTAYIDLRIKEGVQEGLQKALQGKPPKANTTDPTEAQRRDFQKMTYKERLNLFNSDPMTYNKLSKGA